MHSILLSSLAILNYLFYFLLLDVGCGLGSIGRCMGAAWSGLGLAGLGWVGSYGRDGRGAWREEFPRLLPVLHHCTLGRGRMTHVVNNLCAFLMFEVHALGWARLGSRQG